MLAICCQNGTPPTRWWLIHEFICKQVDPNLLALDKHVHVWRRMIIGPNVKSDVAFTDRSGHIKSIS
jgi:hypothetical protein